MAIDDAPDEFRDRDPETLGFPLEELALRVGERDHLFRHGL